MAAPKENLLPLGHLNGSEKNTFTTQRQFSGNKRVMHLQQRWQELKEREYTAQQQNRQLLQQFEKAQDTLKEMLARNAAMKIIRMEYERYLEENSHRWQQQLKEKTQSAQKKRIDDYLSLCLKNAEERVMKSSAGPPTKPQQTATRQGSTDYNHLPHAQSSWLTHSQSLTARFPTRVPQSFLHPPIIPQPYPLHYPASTAGHHYHPWPWQDPQGWASQQPDYPWSQPAGAARAPSYSEAPWGQLYMEEPSRDSRVSQIVGEEDKTSRALSSQRERSVRSSGSHLSQELDVKPVRLSSSHAESSESGRDSSLARRETRKKKERGGRKQCASSDGQRCSSQELSGNSSAILIPSVAVARSSESNPSSEKSSRSSSRKTKRSGGLSVQSPRSEKVAKGRTRDEGDDSESQHTGEESGCSSEASNSEKVGTQNNEEKADRCKEESESQRENEPGSDSVKTENDDAGEVEEQISSSEQSSTEEKAEDETKKNLKAGGDGGEKENSQADEEQEDSNVEQDDDDDVSAKKDATGEEAATSTEDEMEEQGCEEQSIRLKNEGTENIKQGSASSQDEKNASEGSEEKEEEDEESNEQEDGESEKEEEHRSDEDQTDSDDCIITSQEKRSEQMQIISEEAAQEEEDGKTGSSNDDSNEVSDEDIENLLVPQEHTQKEEKSLKADEKPKEIFHNMGIFQVEPDRTKTDDPNDSDEFDHFYD